MALFFGYDPGGYTGGGSNGVVSVEVDEKGVPELLCAATLPDAEEVVAWLNGQSQKRGPAKALGIDTLLAWSQKGYRHLDDKLRSHYKSDGVQQQNSLDSSMTINGVLVASRAYQALGLRLAESHPKLLITAGGGHLCRREDKSKTLCRAEAGRLLLTQEGGPELIRKYNAVLELGDEHQADAFVAAWCASCWHTKPRRWSTDLYAASSDLVFPACPLAGRGALCRTPDLRDPDRLAYPWPEDPSPVNE